MCFVHMLSMKCFVQVNMYSGVAHVLSAVDDIDHTRGSDIQCNREGKQMHAVCMLVSWNISGTQPTVTNGALQLQNLTNCKTSSDVTR